MPSETRIHFLSGEHVIVAWPTQEVVQALSDPNYKAFVGFTRHQRPDVWVRPESVDYLEDVPEGSREPPEGSREPFVEVVD